MEALLGRFMPAGADVDGAFLLKRVDLCHLGFWLGLGSYFLSGDARLAPLGDAVLERTARRRRLELPHAQPAEHAPQLLPHHVQRARGLCGSRPREEQSRSATSVTPKRARSSSCSRTGCTAPTGPAKSSPTASRTSPTRGTGTTRCCAVSTTSACTPAIGDERLDDPIQLLRDRRKPNGRWPLQKRIPGTLLVEMEKPGTESRWNTLRALRVLRRRDNGPSCRDREGRARHSDSSGKFDASSYPVG